LRSTASFSSDDSGTSELSADVKRLYANAANKTMKDRIASLVSVDNDDLSSAFFESRFFVLAGDDLPLAVALDVLDLLGALADFVDEDIQSESTVLDNEHS
jgi:hypothetical protein